MCAIFDTCAQRNCVTFFTDFALSLDQVMMFPVRCAVVRLRCRDSFGQQPDCLGQTPANQRKSGGSCNMEVERKPARSSLHTRRFHSIRRWTGASALSNAALETEELNMPTAACPV